MNVEEQQKSPVAEAVEQAITNQPANEAQAQPEADPATMIRQAMATNFIQHCVNAAAADGDEHPLVSGAMSAVNGLLLAVLNQGGDEQIQQNINLVANALVTIGFGEKTNLAEQLMNVWAVAAGRNGGLNSLLGKMRDASEVDYRSFMQNQLQQLTGNSAPELAMEEVAVADLDVIDSVEVEAESLPADAPEAEQEEA